MLRYEYKYIIPLWKINELRRLILPYMNLDKHAKGREGDQYTIKSIYFDSPSFDFYYEKI